MTDTDTKPADVWIWEFGARDGSAVYTDEEFTTLDDLKESVADSFADYTWEEVERRGIKGTSVLVKQNGRWVDTGHWVYRRPDEPGSPDLVHRKYGPMTLEGDSTR